MSRSTSTHNLAHQLANANDTIRQLQARTLAYEAQHGNTDPVLEAVADMLNTLAQLAEPGVSTGDQEGSTGKPGSRPPSGGDRQLMRMLATFEKRLWDAVRGAERAIEKHGEPRDPVKDDHHEPKAAKWPTVRCRRQGCPDRNKRVPSVHVDEEGVVPVWYCQGCGNAYPNHPVCEGSP